MEAHWAIDAAVSKHIAKVQRSMRRVPTIDPFRRSCDLRNCGFALRNGLGRSRWYSLRDGDRNYLGEVWHNPCPRSPIKNYFAAMLIDGTTFEGSVFADDRDTLVCFRNAVENCRVYWHPIDKTPNSGNWRERLAEWSRRRRERDWTVSVGDTVIGTIETRWRPIQRLPRAVALKTSKGDLPINILKLSDFRRGFDTVIPDNTPIDIDNDLLHILFVVNLAFRVYYFGYDF